MRYDLVTGQQLTLPQTAKQIWQSGKHSAQLSSEQTKHSSHTLHVHFAFHFVLSAALA